MKKQGSTIQAPQTTVDSPPRNRIRPVVIYPFKAAAAADLVELYGYLERLSAPPYVRPITVIDRKTHTALALDPAFLAFRENTVARVSDLLDAWCVDTCQMWYTGLGAAFERGQPGDVYWLIPGDFNYGTPMGKEVLQRLHDLPEIVLELQQDLCVGEIVAGPWHPKQLLDTYSTFALLANWFPGPARTIRETTERPRSEFLAIGHDFLGRALNQRWFAYEQTLAMLVRAALEGRRLSRFSVGDLTDLPEGREPMDAAVLQVERTERVLKTLWVELHREEPDWLHQYQLLERQSDVIRRAALLVLEPCLS